MKVGFINAPTHSTLKDSLSVPIDTIRVSWDGIERCMRTQIAITIPDFDPSHEDELVVLGIRTGSKSGISTAGSVSGRG